MAHRAPENRASGRGSTEKARGSHETEVWALHSQTQVLVRIKNPTLPNDLTSKVVPFEERGLIHTRSPVI